MDVRRRIAPRFPEAKNKITPGSASPPPPTANGTFESVKQQNERFNKPCAKHNSAKRSYFDISRTVNFQVTYPPTRPTSHSVKLTRIIFSLQTILIDNLCRKCYYIVWELRNPQSILLEEARRRGCQVLEDQKWTLTLTSS